ncbi:hypothetical protein [Halorubrum ezzemoulense]|uniref:hypothetical protein n=1 Tax=Halorubrum ezzemoulense TaxID=337243 RepID=UPI0015C5E8B5|nr:hypothetical protein [Halorubrum ezzemoulense]
MTRRVTVELRVDDETVVEEVDASIVATDDAIVEQTRRDLGVAPEDFDRGEVVAP